MKNLIPSGIFNPFMILLFLLSSVSIHAQESQKESDSIPKDIIGFELGEIAEQSEKLGQKILKLRGVLNESEKVAEIDSTVTASTPEIMELIDTTFLTRKDVTVRDLKVRKVEWANFKNILSGYQETIKDRTKEISEIAKEAEYDLERWKKTKKRLGDKSASKDIEEGFDKSISSLEAVLESANSRLERVLITQKKITELMLIIDEEISNIDLASVQRQKDYFVFDSAPIWVSDSQNFMVNDSIDTEDISSTSLIIKGIKQNKKQFFDFFYQNIKTFVIQIVFLIFMFAFLMIANKKYNTQIVKLRDPIEIQAKIVMDNAFLTTLSIGVLITAFFYDAMVPAYAELHVLLVLTGTVLLLPSLTCKKFRPFLWLLYAVYILNTFESFIGIKADLIRWLLIFDSILMIIALHIGRKVVTENPEKFTQIIRIFKPVSILYMIILILSIAANIIGMVALASFISKAVMVSMTFGMITYLAVKVFTSFFILFFKLRRAPNIQTLTVMVKATHQRIRPLFNTVGFIFWLFFTMQGFELYDFILEWVDEVMAMHWRIGEMTISLGGILAFVGIFVITLIISQVASALFQDEWMVDVLPRGVAPAISLVLRIVVVALGLYAGLTAAGVDLSKMGFILGALGVGIGFGLQNVVLNFVSGLILAFERPINLGDTIEVDMEKGVVTNIGVRSSNIRTYSGAEVIVPNGDLISKKVINWTLSNRNRRSKIAMKTALNADPEKVIELFNSIAAEHPNTSAEPAPKTYFYGYDPEGNLSFALMYWTTFSDTLKTDSQIALLIFKALKEQNIQAPAPVRRILKDNE